MTYYSGRGGQVKMELEKLTLLQSVLKSNLRTQVGVLGQKNTRNDIGKVSPGGGHKKSKSRTDMSNADIGLVHENGSLSSGIPRRSFLLMPLQIKSQGIAKIKKNLWEKFLSGDQSLASLKKIYTELGIWAENIIQLAFKTGGFGLWPKLSQRTIYRKKSSAILIDTAQLRASIDSRVVSQ